jgi:segregation and condensation protein A
MTESRPGFAVRLDVFEGPLDALLALIERRDLDISVVSLVAVTDQFLRYLDDHTDLDEIAAYLVVAAKLLLIKSIRLLPAPPALTEVEDAEAVEAVDAAEALAIQLREYRRFKQAAAFLRERDEAGLRSWPRRAPPAENALPKRLAIDLDAEALTRLVFQALQRGEPDAPEAAPVARATVAEQIAVIAPLVASRPVRFSEIAGPSASIDVVVATFLAMLELFRRREIEIDQPETFGEIVLRSRESRENRGR